jgi:hypothetical protein
VPCLPLGTTDKKYQVSPDLLCKQFASKRPDSLRKQPVSKIHVLSNCNRISVNHDSSMGLNQKRTEYWYHKNCIKTHEAEWPA